MPNLLKYVQEYIFSGIPSNATWDLLKATWEKLNERSWEDLFLDAFEEALQEQKPFLEKYGEEIVSLPREELHRVLHHELSANVASMTAGELSDTDFVRQVAMALAEEQSLIIGGHTLSDADYQSLVLRLTQLASDRFIQKIRIDPKAFQHALNAEALRLQGNVKELRSYLEVTFGVVLPELIEMAETTRQVAKQVEQTFRGVENLQQLPGQMSELQKAVYARTAADDRQYARNIEERIYNEQVDRIRDLIQEGKAFSAKVRLESLVQELQHKDMSPDLYYRLFTNLGICCLDLGELKEGCDYLEQAYSHAPESPKAIANLALVALLRQNYDRAISVARQSLEKEVAQPTAVSVLLEASYRLNRFDKLEQDIIQKAEAFRDTRRTLAMLYLEQGLYQKSKQLLNENLNASTVESEDYLYLAQVLLAEIEVYYRNKAPSSQVFNPAHIGQIEKAEAYLDVAIAKLEVSEKRYRYYQSVVLRAVSKRMQDRPEAALSDCQIVLSEAPNYDQALAEAGLAAFLMDDFEEAEHYLRKLSSEASDTEMVRLALAVSLVRLSRCREAIGILEQPNPNPSPELEIDRLHILAEAQQCLGNHDEAEYTVEKLLALDPDSPFVLASIAALRQREGKPVEAEEYLKRALNRATGEERAFTALRLADLFFFQANYDAAASYYEQADLQVEDSPFMQRFLISLLNSGEWGKAYKFAQSIRNNGPAIRVISEVEARVAEHIDELALASQLYSELIKVEPSNPEHFLRAAILEMRRNRPDDAQRFALEMLENFPDHPGMLMQAARMLQMTNYPSQDVLVIAYKAWRLGTSDPLINLWYSGLFLAIDKQSELLLDPQEVAVDTAVKLSTDGQETWHVILDTLLGERRPGEVLTNESMAQKLLGHKKGDVIEISSSPIRSIKGQIIDIQSKYVRAYQEIFLQFNVNFPDDSSIVKFPLPLDDPNKIVYFPFPNQDAHQAILNSYTQGAPITLGFITKVLGKNFVEVWSGLTSDGAVRFRVANGSIREQTIQQHLVSTCEDLTLELTAVLALNALGHVDTLRHRYRNLYVSQSLIDELNNYISSLNLRNKDGAKFISLRNGAVAFDEIPSEQVQQYIDEVASLRNSIRNHCQVIPVTSALEVGHVRFTKLESIIGRQQLDSILIAGQTNSVLLADDFWLRYLATAEHGVKAVWTQPVLADFVRHTLITTEEYFAAIEKLILSNYYFVPYNAEFLLSALEKSKWQIGYRIRRLFQTLEGPYATAESVIEILANVIKGVWSTSMLVDQNYMILDLCLSTLVANRIAAIVVPSFEDTLSAKFALSPLQLFDIHRQIDLWKRTNERFGGTRDIWLS